MSTFQTNLLAQKSNAEGQSRL